MQEWQGLNIENLVENAIWDLTRSYKLTIRAWAGDGAQLVEGFLSVHRAMCWIPSWVWV